MTETITFSTEEVTPNRTAVFKNQGIPADKAVQTRRIETLYAAVRDIFAEVAAPVGILSEIAKADFEVVYRGEGANEPRTPVGDIFGRADSLALFAVTLGEPVCREIEERFAARDFGVGYMLDAVASAATDRAAEATQSRFCGMLSENGRTEAGVGVLCYSPGYCGWHITGQKKLFAHLKPERIGISLRDSFLMEPLKSISGVMIAGPRRLHDFFDTYPFCTRCETRGCRERIRTLLAE